MLIKYTDVWQVQSGEGEKMEKKILLRTKKGTQLYIPHIRVVVLRVQAKTLALLALKSVS